MWIGWSSLLPFVLTTTLAGGALAIVCKFWQMARAEHEIRDFNWLRRILRTNLELPYGIAIAVGAVWVYSGTWWMEGQI